MAAPPRNKRAPMMKPTASPGRVFRWRTPAAMALALAASWGATSVSGQLPPGDHWFTAWSTSQQALGETRITNATVRMIARVTISGDAVRIRLDNSFGTEPVTIGRARVGYRIRGAAIAAGSNRPLTFNGRPDGTIPVGGTLWSDTLAMPVLAASGPHLPSRPSPTGGRGADGESAASPSTKPAATTAASRGASGLSAGSRSVRAGAGRSASNRVW